MELSNNRGGHALECRSTPKMLSRLENDLHSWSAWKNICVRLQESTHLDVRFNGGLMGFNGI